MIFDEDSLLQVAGAVIALVSSFNSLMGGEVRGHIVLVENTLRGRG